MEWKDQKLTSGAIRVAGIPEPGGNTAALRYPGIGDMTVTDGNGIAVDVETLGSDRIRFTAIAGETYYINAPLSYAWAANPGATAAGLSNGGTGTGTGENGQNGTNGINGANGGDKDRGFPIIPVAIGVIIAVAAAAGALMFLRKKKK
jgi:hypothetical protein